MFEIMMSGIPIICTAFLSWKKVIDDNACGICLEPKDEDALTDAIRSILQNREEAEQMGSRGRTAVENHYNWKVEQQKLIDAYRQLEDNRN